MEVRRGSLEAAHMEVGAAMVSPRAAHMEVGAAMVSLRGEGVGSSPLPHRLPPGASMQSLGGRAVSWPFGVTVTDRIDQVA